MTAARLCSRLEPPQNGRVDIDGSTPGSTATYTCFPGFNIIGQSSRSCQLNGVWSGSAPFCQGVSCRVLNAPQNGRVTLSGTQVRDTASYECLPGFLLQGSRVRECQANGQWSRQEPTCVRTLLYVCSTGTFWSPCRFYVSNHKVFLLNSCYSGYLSTYDFHCCLPLSTQLLIVAPCQPLRMETLLSLVPHSAPRLVTAVRQDLDW